MAATSLEEFIKARCTPAQHEAKVFYCNILPSKPDDPKCTAAHITVDVTTANRISERGFWPRPVYVRPWRFQASADLAGQQETTHTEVRESHTPANITAGNRKRPRISPLQAQANDEERGSPHDDRDGGGLPA